MEYDAFLTKEAERAGVSPDVAETLTRATFEVLADRISGGEAQDLAEPLPEPLKGWLRTDEEIAKGYGANSFVRRVADRAEVPRELAEAGIPAVLATLREAVGDQEFRDATAQLPREYDILLPSSAGPGGAG
ncbi:DUF2267 domain-containing protein [Streptomyces griseoluteus]|uniref:DUF2267 domain-containing protein n=1 Tax=Streptomyces griseoluteus TaxID=29306 RepID=UPI0036F5B73F